MYALVTFTYTPLQINPDSIILIFVLLPILVGLPLVWIIIGDTQIIKLLNDTIEELTKIKSSTPPDDLKELAIRLKLHAIKKNIHPLMSFWGPLARYILLRRIERSPMIEKLFPKGKN